MTGIMKTGVSCIALFLFLTGCASPNAYQVEAKNNANRPVTLWLTKDGPPDEDGWRTPEQLVTMPTDLQKYDLAFVPVGKTGSTGKVTGTFPKGTHAVLRVYDGEKELHALSVTPSTDRVDYTLRPGNNKLQIIDRAGKLAVEPN
jgi:hypothetical protein